jgi:hypothetical protein
LFRSNFFALRKQMIRLLLSSRSEISFAFPARERSFKAIINLANPQAAKLHVVEELTALSHAGKASTAQYLHRLINLALCHYHLGEFVEAREVALLAHARVVAAKGSSNSLVYFSATTAAHCSDAVVNSFKLYRSQQNAISANSDALAPSAAKTLRGDAALTKLQEEVQTFKQIAQNCLADPRNSFMNSNSKFRGNYYDDDASCNSETTRRTKYSSTTRPERANTRAALQVHSISRVPK